MRLAVIASHPIQYQAPLFRELAQRIDLTVFFAHRATPADQACAGFGVEFDWDIDLLSGYEHVFLRNVALRPGLDSFSGCDTPDVRQHLAEGSFDAVLLMGWNLKSFGQAIYAAKRLRLPILVRGDSQLQTTRGAWKQAAKALAYPLFLRLFDAALYVGERSRAYWIHYRYPPERLFFSPHGVDAEWFARRATDEARTALRTKIGIALNTNVALFAGKLVPFKRPLDLVAAAAQSKSEGREIEVLVAGSGPLQLEMMETARRAAVPCHMLGFCNQSEMPAAYAAADVLVLPSESETWGLVANEALACGRPVVLSDAVGAAPDLAADGSVGRVYPMGDVAALTTALDDVFLYPRAGHAIAARAVYYSNSTAAEGVLQATDFAVQRKLNKDQEPTKVGRPTYSHQVKGK